MPIFNTRHGQAQILIGLLAVALLVGLWPYVTGLIGGPVLYVLFSPLHRSLRRYVHGSVAAAAVVAVAILVLVLPGILAGGLVAREAQNIATDIIEGPTLEKLSTLQIGDFELGPRLANIGENVATWLGSSAFDLLGTATNLLLNVVIALFVLYFLLLRPGLVWDTLAPYVPFCAENTEKLRQRFHDVTYSTVIGLGATAVAQGGLLTTAFLILGLSGAFFWGVVTAVLSILPVIGSGAIWGPAAVGLVLDERWLAALVLILTGSLIIATVDNIIRPVVYRKWANVHPITTVVGALAGIRFFGVLGLLIGPLAISYFFVLMRMYREEYLLDEEDNDD